MKFTGYDWIIAAICVIIILSTYGCNGRHAGGDEHTDSAPAHPYTN